VRPRPHPRSRPHPRPRPLARRPLTEPAPDRLAADAPERDAILAAHARAMAHGAATYPDPGSGLAVFTAAFLAARGTCCESGCRHCPYAD